MVCSGFTWFLTLSLASSLCGATPASLLVTVEHTPTAADCADAAALLAKVGQLAQRKIKADPSDIDPIRVTIRFDRIHGEYRASLEFQGPKPGERSFSDRSDHCDSLEDAVAVAITLLLDNEIERRATVANQTERHAEPTITIARGAIEPRPLRNARSYVALEGGAQSGFNSTTVPSFAADFGVGPAAGWLIEASVWDTLPTTSSYATGEVTVSFIAGALRACRLWGNEWQWGPCTGIAVGRLHGAGRGFDDSLASSLLWSGFGGSWLLQRSLGRHWDLGLHALAWLPFTEHRFAVQNLGVAWHSAPFQTGLNVRLGFRFR
jgi:hypothetical protein